MLSRVPSSPPGRPDDTPDDVTPYLTADDDDTNSEEYEATRRHYLPIRRLERAAALADGDALMDANEKARAMMMLAAPAAAAILVRALAGAASGTQVTAARAILDRALGTPNISENTHRPAGNRNLQIEIVPSRGVHRND